MEQEIEDKRVIVMDEDTQRKYTVPDYKEAAFIIDGTCERVRKQLKDGRETLVYGRYRVFPYSETKWEELRKKGYADGSLYDIYKMRLDNIFGGVYS